MLCWRKSWNDGEREGGKEEAKVNTRKKWNKGDWFHGLDVLGCFSHTLAWRTREDRPNIQIVVLQRLIFHMMKRFYFEFVLTAWYGNLIWSASIAVGASSGTTLHFPSPPKQPIDTWYVNVTNWFTCSWVKTYIELQIESTKYIRFDPQSKSVWSFGKQNSFVEGRRLSKPLAIGSPDMRRMKSPPP